jgi:hypothetical protein
MSRKRHPQRHWCGCRYGRLHFLFGGNKGVAGYRSIEKDSDDDQDTPGHFES